MKSIENIGIRLSAVKVKMAEKLGAEYEGSQISGNDMVKIRSELIGIHAEALSGDPGTAIDKMKIKAKEIGVILISSGYTLESALENTKKARQAFWDFFEEEVNQERLSASALLQAASIVDQVLDASIISISECYIASFKENAAAADDAALQIKENKMLIEELSAPVVQTVLEGTLLVPFIGRIDASRMEAIQMNVLSSCSENNAEYIILDFSGQTEDVDAFTFHLLDQLVKSLKLIGTEPRFAGFSPGAARKIVEQGLVNDVKTFGSFRQAMYDLFSEKGISFAELAK
ncbi:Anti-anti-sigma regulatory factor (antagonist of anti-sigma factor) [Bacillus sp. OV322]|uniref:STAS domain-containing protein n=1 Tax=Bacillus sp. OV322 TaxID=1882764 RepID=UPI0008EBFF85|nr:STAS domain-containing protein [Bacillus sp. OV322]SFC30325.1 Anti-anti-sigma regulatory factor (antagonist of anti-sigma factor) [Bacillus sp. OV322]